MRGYGKAPTVEAWVPLRMEDTYEIPGLENVRGEAVYTNHRVFQTSARTIGASG